MTGSPSNASTPYTVEVLPDGIFLIRLHAPITLTIVHAIGEELASRQQDRPTPAGFLVDVSSLASLSVVRLTDSSTWGHSACR